MVTTELRTACCNSYYTDWDGILVCRKCEARNPEIIEVDSDSMCNESGMENVDLIKQLVPDKGGEIMFHHGESHNIWRYCLHLGPWTYEGQNFDLGILHNPGRSEHLSLAVVYGPENHQYISGPTYIECRDDNIHKAIRNEVIKRYEAYIKEGE